MSKEAGGTSFWVPYVQHRGLLIMLVPGLVFFFIFHYIPMGGIIIAFKDFNLREGIMGSQWNGLENFERLFLGKGFPDALRNTVIISALRLGCGFFAPIILALLLNEIRLSWYKRTIQTLTYLPFFFSWVILGGIFLAIFSTGGPINSIVKSFGGKEILFFSSDGWFLFMLISTGIWQGVGYGAIIYLASLSGIDPGLYEATVVDGAGRWKQTIHITIPCMVPTICTLFILSLGGVLDAGFDQIYNLYKPAVYDVADIIDTYVLRRLTTMDFTLGAAAGVFKSIIGLGAILTVNAIVRRSSDGELGLW